MLPKYKNLEMVRGDTLAFGLKIFINAAPDEVYFSCRTKNESYIFTKTIGNDVTLCEDHTSDSTPYIAYKFRIAPEDTRGINIIDYIYDIKLKFDDNIRTILSGNLTLLPEVTVL